MNQCDGCRRHLPMIDGIHMDFGYDMIGCTKDRYIGETTMLSRKDYKAIAEIVKEQIEDEIRGKAGASFIAYDLADYFAQDNPRFDRERFLEAAGV